MLVCFGHIEGSKCDRDCPRFFFFVKVSSIVIMNDDDSDDHDEKHSDADCGGGCAHDNVFPVNKKKHKRQAT